MYNCNGLFDTMLSGYFRTLLVGITTFAGGILGYLWYNNSKPLANTVEPSNNGISDGLNNVKSEIQTW